MESPKYNNLNNETVLCLSCMRENDARAAFCRYCNVALDLTGNPDLLQRFAAEGDLYSKAAEGKPKLIVLIGIWVIFPVPLIFSVVSAFSMITEGGGGTSSFIFFWFLIAVSCFSFMMLYKVTKNYLKAKEQ